MSYLWVVWQICYQNCYYHINSFVIGWVVWYLWCWRRCIVGRWGLWLVSCCRNSYRQFARKWSKGWYLCEMVGLWMFGSLIKICILLKCYLGFGMCRKYQCLCFGGWGSKSMRYFERKGGCLGSPLNCREYFLSQHNIQRWESKVTDRQCTVFDYYCPFCILNNFRDKNHILAFHLQYH